MRRLALCTALILLGTGCFQTRYFYEGPKVLTTGPALDRPTEVVGHFKAHDRGFYLLYGLIPIGEPVNGAALAAEQVGDHDGAINLQFSDGQDTVDMLVSNLACVLSILCGTWSVWAEGDVVNVVGEEE